MKSITLALTMIVFTGCTSIKVTPIPALYNVQKITIKNNPKVIVSDYVPVIREGFDRHGISTEISDNVSNNKDKFSATYTALRNWDIIPYLTHGEVKVWYKGRIIGSATYHLIGNGGLSFYKWQGVKTKIDPVMDQLLKEYYK